MLDMKERPPYVRFGVEAVEDRQKTIAEGRYMARDVNFVYITPAGSKDVLPRDAEEWLADCREKARRGRMPHEWVQRFEGAYKAWKDGIEPATDGTPLRGWALLSPARADNYIRSNVRTVEDLAAMTEEAIRNCGMGARNDKLKAAAWLEQAKTGADAGKVAALQTENEQLRGQVSDLTSSVQELAAQVKALQEPRPRGRPRKSPDDDDVLKIEDAA